MIFVCLLVLAGDFRPACEAAESGATEKSWPALREESFRLVWSTVNEAYFDPTFGGVDWKAVRERYAARLAEAGTPDDLRALLQGMLNELGRSHFGIVPREMAVFTPGERKQHGTTGADVMWLEGKLIVTAVQSDSAAERAGLRIGTEIEQVEGRSIAEMSESLKVAGLEASRAGPAVASYVTARLGAPVGTELKVAGRAPDGTAWSATLVSEEQRGAWSEPIGNYPSVPLRLEARRGPDGIGYLRLNVFAPGLMTEIRALLRSLKPGDALVVDLRGNPGGLTQMAPAITGWLIDREVTLGATKLRQGRMNFMSYPQSGAFLGPLAVLIDAKSASTSEIFAAGLQGIGRARIFGEPSAGAALPSAFRALPTGDLFQYAIGDVVTPRGASIEGRGVQPDEIVRRTAEDIAKGYDPVLETARDWLDARRQAARRK